jgi:uncharacterized membrane protein YeaQ/YmgE (transglycosylase-associated protein family)
MEMHGLMDLGGGVGILGSLVGGILANALNIRLGEMFHGWFWGNLLVSIAGAVVLIVVFRAIRGRSA